MKQISKFFAVAMLVTVGAFAPADDAEAWGMMPWDWGDNNGWNNGGWMPWNNGWNNGYRPWGAPYGYAPYGYSPYGYGNPYGGYGYPYGAPVMPPMPAPAAPQAEAPAAEAPTTAE